MTSVTSSKSSMYKQGKGKKNMLAHVQRMCEAHDTVMRSYYQHIHGSSGADATTSIEIGRTSSSVNNSHFFCHQLLKKGQDGAKLE